MANWLNGVLKYEANYLTSENTQIQKIQKEKIKAMKRKKMNKNTTPPPPELRYISPPKAAILSDIIARYKLYYSQKIWTKTFKCNSLSYPLENIAFGRLNAG